MSTFIYCYTNFYCKAIVNTVDLTLNSPQAQNLVISSHMCTPDKGTKLVGHHYSQSKDSETSLSWLMKLFVQPNLRTLGG